MIKNDAHFVEEKQPKIYTIKRGVTSITIESPNTKPNALEAALNLVMYELRNSGDRLQDLCFKVNRYYFIMLQMQRDKEAKKAGRYSAELDEPLPTDEAGYMSYWRNLMETRER